jgi:hypothetical protein
MLVRAFPLLSVALSFVAFTPGRLHWLRRSPRRLQVGADVAAHKREDRSDPISRQSCRRGERSEGSDVGRLQVWCVVVALSAVASDVAGEPISVPSPLQLSAGEAECFFAGEACFFDGRSQGINIIFRLPIPPVPFLPALFQAPFDLSNTTDHFNGFATLRDGSQSVSLNDVRFSLVFRAPPQPLPPVQDDGFGVPVAIFTAVPFRMTGTFSGTSEESGTLYSFDLLGQGHGTVTGAVINGVFLGFDGSWTFEPAAPIPEPGTILLLSATGLAGLIRRQGRHRRTTQMSVHFPT